MLAKLQTLQVCFYDSMLILYQLTSNLQCLTLTFRHVIPNISRLSSCHHIQSKVGSKESALFLNFRTELRNERKNEEVERNFTSNDYWHSFVGNSSQGSRSLQTVAAVTAGPCLCLNLTIASKQKMVFVFFLVILCNSCRLLCRACSREQEQRFGCICWDLISR